MMATTRRLIQMALTGSFLLQLLLPLIFAQLPPQAILYDQVDCKGVYIIVTENIPRLSSENFDNRTLSLCSKGMWMLYDDPSYNDGGSLGMTDVINTNATCNCRNLDLDNGLVSSIRLSGSKIDFFDDMFTLYEYPFYSGTQETFTRNSDRITLTSRHGSFVITGRNNWTVFEQSYFMGPHICLVTPGYNQERPSPLNISNITDAGLRDGVIRSLKKGCDPTSPVVYL